MKPNWIRLGTFSAVALVMGCNVALVMGCDVGDHSNLATGAGGTTSGGTTTSGAGGSEVSPVSGLPIPPGAGGQAPPSGAAGDLQVVPWAGFTSAVSYTFDDAQPSQIQHWPDLKAEGIRGTFYLNTMNQGSETDFDATWQDALASGWELGNHTVHHCYEDGDCINGATFTTVDEELDGVTTYITGTAKQADVWTLAYPYGDTSWETAAKPRFALARGIYSGTITPSTSVDPYNLPCVEAIAAGGQPASDFIADVDMAKSQGAWMIFLFHSITPTPSANIWYAPTDITSITGSIDHAKSLGDVWIDTLADVGAYWLGGKLVTATSAAISGSTSTWTWTLPAHFPTGKYIRVTVSGGKLTQGGQALPWNEHGFYEVALDAGSLTLSP